MIQLKIYIIQNYKINFKLKSKKKQKFQIINYKKVNFNKNIKIFLMKQAIMKLMIKIKLIIRF